jgi:cysteine-rich repeat protein
VSARGLPQTSECLAYTGAFLDSSYFDFGPGCTFYCGDGFLDRVASIQDEGEDCDDGNRVDDDGCSSQCRVKRAYRKVSVTGDAVGAENVGGVISYLALNDAGRSAALLSLASGSTALVRYSPSSAFSMITRQGDPVPGRSGLTYLALSGPPNYTDGGVGVLPCTMQNAEVVAGLCRAFSPSGTVAAQGDPAGSGTLFRSIPAWGTLQPTVLAASLEIGPGGVTASNDTGLWLEPSAGAALQLVAREGSAAPGGLGGALLEDLSAVRPSIAVGPTLAFATALRIGTGGVSADNDALLYRGPSGALIVAAREGGAAPGTAGVFDAFLPGSPAGPGLNGAGDVAFDALLKVGIGGVAAENRAGVWKTAGGVRQLVARAGNAAPGTPAGVVFGGFQDVVLDDAGDVAFVATLTGPGVSPANDRGIWSDRGALEMLARTGSPARGAPGLIFGAFSGGPSLNAVGQLLVPAVLQIGPGGVTAATDTGLWLSDTVGTLQLLVREGDSLDVAPGDAALVTALGAPVGQVGWGAATGGPSGSTTAARRRSSPRSTTAARPRSSARSPTPARMPTATASAATATSRPWQATTAAAAARLRAATTTAPISRTPPRPTATVTGSVTPATTARSSPRRTSPTPTATAAATPASAAIRTATGATTSRT